MSNVEDRMRLGVKAYRRYRGPARQEFIDLVGVTPEQANNKYTTLPNEFGVNYQGVLMVDDGSPGPDVRFDFPCEKYATRGR